MHTQSGGLDTSGSFDLSVLSLDKSDIQTVPDQMLTEPTIRTPTHDLSIRRLLDHGATRITHWTTGSDGKLQAIVVEGKTDDTTQRCESLLAAYVLQTGKTNSRVSPSDAQCTLVGTPVRGVSGLAITVLFPNCSLGIEKDRSFLRQCEVELAAAHQAIDQLQYSQQNHNDRLTSIGRTPAGDRLSTSEVSPSWKSIRSDIKEQFVELWRKHRVNRRLYAMAIAAAIIVSLVPWPHVVKCKVKCEPATQRFVVAPFEAKLLEACVETGQLVNANQILAILDGSNLRNQIASLRAKLSQANQRRVAALSDRDASKSEFERMEVKHLQRELEILESREQNLQIRSPISGVVVKGDLKRVVGSPLTIGQTLFEIGPLNELVAEIAIRESDIAYVKPGQLTRISLEASPGVWHNSKITRIHPRNEIRDFDSVFIAEAEMQNRDLEVRPGMNGIARIDASWQPIGWLLFHRSIEGFRQLIGW